MIQRSLPERFCPKVAPIDGNQDLNFFGIEKLVGNLHTYEANRCQDKKSKDIAFLSSKYMEDNSNGESDCDSDVAEFEELFVKKLKKLWKNKKKKFEKEFSEQQGT